MYYVAENYYASPTSRGFANTWRVLVFETKKDADTYVEEDDKLGTQRILRKDVPKWHGLEVRPFSDQYIGIRPIDTGPWDKKASASGLIGDLGVCCGRFEGEPFYG